MAQPELRTEHILTRHEVEKMLQPLKERITQLEEEVAHLRGIVEKPGAAFQTLVK